MTISTTASVVTAQGNGATTSWPFSFLIPTGAIKVTLTLRSDGTTQVLSSSAYSVSGLDNPAGGTVTYPLSGSPLASTYNITIERVVPYTQTSNFTNQGDFNPEALDEALDTVVMQIQQLKTLIDNAIAFPLGASETTVDELITDILNGAANATAAAASAAAAAASAAAIEALLPLAAANIGTGAVETAKIASNAVTPIKLATASVPYAGGMLNGYLVESRAANAATFAVKTLAGTDPSATDPVYVAFRSATVGSGAFVIRTLTSALTLTLSAGSTLGFTSAVAARVWLVIFDDAGTLRLGAINCRSGVNVFPLGRWPVASSTAEGGAGGADTAQVFYTGTAVTAKAYAVIGYASYETGLATAGNWAAAPTRLQMYRESDILPGQTVQELRSSSGAVATGTTVVPFDDTIPQITEGDEYLTQAITPSSAVNVLEIEAQIQVTNSANQNFMAAMLFQDATADALAVGGSHLVSLASFMIQLEVKHAMIAAGTAATTMRLRAGGDQAGTTTVNGSAGARKFGGVLTSFLQVREIAA